MNNSPSLTWLQKRRLILGACSLWLLVTLAVLLLAPYWRQWGYPYMAFYSVVLGLPIFYLVLIGVFHRAILPAPHSVKELP